MQITKGKLSLKGLAGMSEVKELDNESSSGSGSDELDEATADAMADIKNRKTVGRGTKVFNKETFEMLRLQALLKEADLGTEIHDDIFQLPSNKTMIMKNKRRLFNPKFTLN